MKIVVDENLALIDYFFAELATVHSCAGRGLNPALLQDADALMVRSVTQVNAQLLAQSRVKFVGSATIGTDHIDQQALVQMGIAWANAPGCNAQAVAEYVITAILALQPERLNAGQNFCLGVVGLGNVGSRLAKMAQWLGWRVIAYDPLLSRSSASSTAETIIHCDTLTQLLNQADAVSLHVPLTRTGLHPTYHLIDAAALAQMQPHAMLINSSRGAVVEQTALLYDLNRTQRPVVLDVFEFEPKIPAALIDAVALVTPHIAGYSLEGKAKGTQMIYQSFCEYFELPKHKDNRKDYRSQLALQPDYFSGQPLQQALAQHLCSIYPIFRDDAALRACVQQGQVDAAAFDHLRKTYPLRREWAAYAGPSA